MTISRRGALAVLAAPLTRCAPFGDGAVRVGSKNFTEELVLGELYAQTLAAHGVAVVRRLDLGATQIATAALLRGEIDCYPEYTGTALLTVLGRPAISDPRAAYDAVARAYRERWNLRWLRPAPFDDSQALASTRATATRLGLRTLSEVAVAAPRLTLGTTPEFLSRPDGLPGLRARYGGFDFRRIVQLDNGLKYAALVRGDVDVVVAFTTDGEIAVDRLVVFADDKHLFPAYQAAPVVRAAAIAAHPRLAPALDALAPLLTTATMQRLNEDVDGPAQREPADVARTFLRERGVA